jgi:hypothetical protein
VRLLLLFIEGESFVAEGGKRRRKEEEEEEEWERRE